MATRYDLGLLNSGGTLHYVDEAGEAVRASGAGITLLQVLGNEDSPITDGVPPTKLGVAGQKFLQRQNRTLLTTRRTDFCR